VWVVGVLWGGGGDAGFGVVSGDEMRGRGRVGWKGGREGCCCHLRFLLSKSISSLNWKHGDS
jgi:hypothetical protein